MLTRTARTHLLLEQEYLKKFIVPLRVYLPSVPSIESIPIIRPCHPLANFVFLETSQHWPDIEPCHSENHVVQITC